MFGHDRFEFDMDLPVQADPAEATSVDACNLSGDGDARPFAGVSNVVVEFVLL